MEEQIVNQVNKIIQTNLDRQEGYEKALEQVKDPTLKTLFEDCSNQSKEYAQELRQIVVSHGGEPVKDTSAAGDLYRVWMDLKSALSMDNAKAALQSCERGEDVALSAYREATEPKRMLLQPLVKSSARSTGRKKAYYRCTTG